VLQFQTPQALAEYLLGDIELRHKYLKLPDPVENELAQKSRELGLPEGILLGLGAVLVLLLDEIFKGEVIEDNEPRSNHVSKSTLVECRLMGQAA